MLHPGTKHLNTETYLLLNFKDNINFKLFKYKKKTINILFHITITAKSNNNMKTGGRGDGGLVRVESVPEHHIEIYHYFLIS